MNEEEYYELLGLAESIMDIDPDINTPLSDLFENIIKIINDYENKKGWLKT